MSGNGWVAEAPCAGDFRFGSEVTAAEDPTAPLVLSLLSTCQDCPFRAQCVALVLPRTSRFDGVCGGRLWHSGRILTACEAAEPDELHEGRRRPITHGTEAGARAHRRRQERVCSLCLEADRLAQQARRDRKRTTNT